MMSIYIFYILSDKFDTINFRSESEKNSNYLYSYLSVSDCIRFVYIRVPFYHTISLPSTQSSDGLPCYDVGKPEEIEDGHAWSREILLAQVLATTSS